MGFLRSGSIRLSRMQSARKSLGGHDKTNVESKNRPLPSIPIPQTGPLLSLPIELIQRISFYLDNPSAASFCLSTRYICYAVGRDHLSNFLAAAYSKFERRKNIEILERAFPSHWYCAWCDKFHRHELDGGPKSFKNETRRDCAEFNSYLHDSWDYVLCYHHVRLALNRELWGREYGIGMDAFAYEESALRNIGKFPAQSYLKCEARIVSGRLFLHATYRLTVPSRDSFRHRGVIRTLMPALPHIVVGHRDSHSPHTGMHRALEKAIQINTASSLQLCSACATDFCVNVDTNVVAESFPAPLQSTAVLEIQVWRDLGNGRNPFDTQWRAHGELGSGVEGFTGDVMRLTRWRNGEVKEAFDKGCPYQLHGDSRGDARGPWEADAQDHRNTTFVLDTSWTQEIIRSRAKRPVSLGKSQEGGAREENDVEGAGGVG